MHAGGEGLLALGANIDLAGRVLSDQHDRKSGGYPEAGLKVGDLSGHPGAQAVCLGPTVDKLSFAHADL